MTQKIVKALHSISHNIHQEMEPTGKYTAFGDPIMRSVTTEIEPHTLFDITIFPEDQQKELWQLGAISEVSQIELALWERMTPDDRNSKKFNEVRSGYGSETSTGEA